MSVQVNQSAYTLLLSFAVSAGKAQGEVDKATEALKAKKEGKAGAYDQAVLAAIACKTADVFEETMKQFMDNIRQNRGGLATKVKAEKRDEAGRNGETHKIPSSVSTAKTVLLFAMRNGVPLELEGTARPYGEIRDENQSIRDLAHDKEENERIAKATGAEKALYDAQDACSKLTAALPTMSESWLKDVVKYALNAVETSAKEAAEAEQAIASAAAKVAKGVEGSGDKLAKALKQRKAA